MLKDLWPLDRLYRFGLPENKNKVENTYFSIYIGLISCEQSFLIGLTFLKEGFSWHSACGRVIANNIPNINRTCIFYGWVPKRLTQFWNITQRIWYAEYYNFKYEIIKMCKLKLTWLMSCKYISPEIDQCWDNEWFKLNKHIYLRTPKTIFKILFTEV